MTPASSTTRALALALLASSGLALIALPARAQGTPEQQQACAPDAIRLCQDTIPDVGRTTACMRVHRAELSPRCKVVFDAAEPAATKPKVARAPKVEHAPPKVAKVAARPASRETKVSRPHPHVAAAMPPHQTVRHHVAALRGDADTREARRVIGRLCGHGVIDPKTCGFMSQMMTLAE